MPVVALDKINYYGLYYKRHRSLKEIDVPLVTERPGLLDPSVAGVMIQFSFGRKELVSPWFWRPQPENLKERYKRKAPRSDLPDGILFIPPGENTVDVSNFVDDLAKEGWALTDGLAQEREDPKRRGHFYCMVRFVFHRTPLAVAVDPEFAKLIELHYAPALRSLSADAMWRVRAYRNYIKSDGEKQRFAMSINCEARLPYLDGMGKPAVKWEVDSQGQRIGEKASPIRPEKFLAVRDGEIKLIQQT